MSANNPKLYEIKPKSMSSEEIERWLRSVQADLEEPGVFVPEMNSIRWYWDAEENKDKPKFAFLIPVPYRGSIANLGINILHEELNRYRNQICERIYYPYPKLFRRLIKNNIPLFSNESFHQAKDFEVLGISSYYPLQFLGFPRLIKMSGMEPLAKDRKEEDPIIMFGGVAAFNPAPVADFVDVVNLGDGEGVLADAVQIVHDMRKAGKSKYDILVELQKKVPGVYVPALYKEEYYPKDDPHRPNQFKAHVPLRDDIPVRIKKVTCEIKDVRPVSRIIQPNSLGDDMSSGAVEITRGCFAAGTMITTEDGFVPIEQVKPGTRVLSYRADGTPCLSVSQGAVQTNVTEVFLYKMKSGSIRCTNNHKFLTSSLSWEAAKDVLNFKRQLFVQKKRQHTFDRDAFLTSLIASDMCFTEKATANGRPMKFEQKASRPGLQYLESLCWHSDVYSRREGMRLLNFYPDSKGYDFTLKMFGRFSCSSDKKPLLKVSPENAASIVYGCMAGDRTTRKNPSQFILSSQSEALAKFYGTALSMLGIRYNWMVLNDANRKFPRYCCRVQHYEDLLRLKDIAEQFSSIVPCDVDWSFIKEAKKKERYTFGSAISLGVQPVYDMTVEDTHCYVADGFVVHNCGHKSFAKGTLISTDKGLVPIENVTSGHKILTENPDGTREFTEQLGSFSTGIKQTSLYRIAGTSKEFECTDDHRFAVKNFDGSEGITSYVDAQRIAENPNNLDYSLYAPNAIIGEFDRGAYDCGLAISSSQSTELSQENVASFVLGLMRSCFFTEEDRAGYLTKAAFDLLSPEAKNLVANALTLCGIRWEEGENSVSVLRSDLFKLVAIQQEYASEVAPIKEYKVYDESTAMYLEKVEELGEQEVWDIETQVHNFYANGVLVHNCSFCFDADTMIATSKGLKRIADVTSDDAIVSLNENGNRCLSKTDGAVLVGEQEVHEFKATNTNVVCTPDHKFLTEVKNYVPAKQIASAGIYLYQPKFEYHPFDREAYLVAVIGSDFTLTDKARYPAISQLKGRPCIEYLASLKLHNTETFGKEPYGATTHYLRYSDGYVFNLARRVFGRCYSREKDPKYELTPESSNSFIFGMLSTDCALRRNAKGPQLIFNSLSEKWIYFIASALTMSGIKYLLDKKHDRYTCSVSSMFEIKKLKQIADSFKDIYVVDIDWPTLEPKYQRKKMNVAHPSLGVRKVYDLTVYDTHCYFANGFAVHNCEGSFRSMPYRERDLEDIYKAIDDTLLDSGSSSLTPYAFNLSDHHRIFDILQYAMTKWPTRIGMSSQHINHFSEQMADMALMTGTRSITIALESADPVMRRRIGKTLTDETVERVFRLIIRKGFTSIKVYMISNLPMEDDESLHEIENFSRKLIRWQIEEQSPNFASKEEAHAYVSRPEFDEEIDKFAASCKLAFRNKTKIIPEGEEYWNLHLKYKLTTRIKFSYTSFNGKAHTPMQWAQVLPLDEEGFPSIRRDMHTIFDVIQACGHSFRMSGDLEISTLNQVLSYADRRFSQVLIDLCNDERFNYMGTLVAGSNNTMKDFADLMAGRGFDFKFFYREKELDEPFPWDFINMGVTRAYLEKRWQMYKSATDDIRCQEECTKCGGCTKVSRELFKRYWTEGLEEKKYKFEVTPIIKRENTCKIRFRFRMRPEYRWLYGFNKKQWLRRAFYRAGFPIRTNISLASDGIEFNNFTYGADYGEVWLYSKNFDKNNIVERLNATFDEPEPLLQFEDAMVGESASPFKEDVGSIAYSVQIPSKMYTKATLDGHIQSLLNKDEIIIKQKVASSVKRDSTETISIDVKDKLSQLFSVGDEGFTTVYFKLTYGINPYSLLVTLLNTSLSRSKKFPIEVRDYLGRDNDDSFDMFAEICEECGEPIERNIFDDVIGDKYCLKCATLHEKHVLVANLDAEDTDDDSDLDNFDLSFFEDDDMADTNEELHCDE